MNFILILIYVYSLGECLNTKVLGYSINSPLWTLFTFNIVHISFIHLLINSIVFISYWKILKEFINKYVFTLMVILIPAISAYLSFPSIPTVGASAMIYTMTGIYMYMIPIKKYILIQMWVMIILSFVFTILFAPHVNTLIHIYSFFISYFLSVIIGRRMYA